MGKHIWILNYAVTYPGAVIKYSASDMCVHVHMDTSYLSVPKARSRASGLFFLSNHPDKVAPAAAKLNGTIHIN